MAVLFADPKGIYSQLPDVDLWDGGRDARSYVGPHPVVAHPPCQLWTNFAALNFKRYDGEHNRPGNDGGCFESALTAVRTWGGVLEHPAFTHAWKAHALLPPSVVGWQKTGRTEWVSEVWQSAYGHRARKRTWLFYSGQAPPLEALWERPKGTHQVGWFDRAKPTLSKKEASATPRAFAEYLISLARKS